MKLFVLLTLLAIVCHGQHIPNTKGMHLLSLDCKTSEQLSFVQSFSANPDINFLKNNHHLNEPVDVLVGANELNYFKNALPLENIHYEIISDDVSKLIAKEKIDNEIARQKSFLQQSIPRRYLRAFTHYPRFYEIEAYLKNLVSLYPKTTSLLEIGKSYEGRPLYVVKISSGGKDKPAVWIDAGIHPREWIAPTTALYALHQLVTVESNSKLYDNVDWYIMPMANPDGYEFTHTVFRFWRKTTSLNRNSYCIGADANRNFGYKWMTGGSSNDPCEETYAGSAPFSEVETQAIRDFILKNKDTIKVYVSLHSFGQYILHPWASTAEPPKNAAVLRAVAEKAAKALYKKYGTEYVVGTASTLLYPASGGSDDWVLGVAGVDLAYVIELPGNRFDPPANSIIPIGIETFEAIKVFGNYVEQKYGSSRQQ